MIYVNVDSPNLGFTYFNCLGGASEKKNHPVYDKDSVGNDDVILPEKPSSLLIFFLNIFVYIYI